MEALGTLDANSKEFHSELTAITEQLMSMLSHYEKVLDIYKMNAPYVRSTSRTSLDPF